MPREILRPKSLTQLRPDEAQEIIIGRIEKEEQLFANLDPTITLQRLVREGVLEVDPQRPNVYKLTGIR